MGYIRLIKLGTFFIKLRFFLPQISGGGHPPWIRQEGAIAPLPPPVTSLGEVFESHRPLCFSILYLKCKGVASQIPLCWSLLTLKVNSLKIVSHKPLYFALLTVKVRNSSFLPMAASRLHLKLHILEHAGGPSAVVEIPVFVNWQIMQPQKFHNFVPLLKYSFLIHPPAPPQKKPQGGCIISALCCQTKTRYYTFMTYGIFPLLIINPFIISFDNYKTYILIKVLLQY